ARAKLIAVIGLSKPLVGVTTRFLIDQSTIAVENLQTRNAQTVMEKGQIKTFIILISVGGNTLRNDAVLVFIKLNVDFIFSKTSRRTRLTGFNTVGARRSNRESRTTLSRNYTTIPIPNEIKT